MLQAETDGFETITSIVRLANPSETRNKDKSPQVTLLLIRLVRVMVHAFSFIHSHSFIFSPHQISRMVQGWMMDGWMNE
jgi:hypothetical protein